MSIRECPVCHEPMTRYDGRWICDECAEEAV